ncbi:lactonase family protein [Nocardia sp. CDC153]|uniref:lactonase family protein n=1 Tax=Nocardia sp. CDC153 TaxID=3112167 RepID=UPI002DBB380C|nr:lactonase family protein [Nocardia sp. CDC153]MEC3956942.1 lactonase family protein [Nocardia sp. CDC153]
MTTTVYVSNAGSAEISALRLDPDGTLRPPRTIPVRGAVMPLAVAPGGHRLYASLRSVPYSVACFDIDAGTGELTELATVPLPDNMAYLSVDRGGRYLLAASYTGNVVSVSALRADGRAAESVAVQSTPPHAHSIVADPTNRFVFATALGGDVILRYRFDAEGGLLTPEPGASIRTKPGAGPRHLLFHPSGGFAYVSNELDGTVSAFEFDNDTGDLTAIDTYTVIPHGYPEPWTSELRCTPDGRYLYVSERRSSTLAGFAIDSDSGALHPLGHTATETCPRGFDIDPTGRYLVAAGQESDSLTVHAIAPGTGALTTLARYPVGRDPNWVQIVSSTGRGHTSPRHP